MCSTFCTYNSPPDRMHVNSSTLLNAVSPNSRILEGLPELTIFSAVFLNLNHVEEEAVRIKYSHKGIPALRLRCDVRFNLYSVLAFC